MKDRFTRTGGQKNPKFKDEGLENREIEGVKPAEMILKEHNDSWGQNVAENHTFQIKRLKALSFPKPCLGNHIAAMSPVQLLCPIKKSLSRCSSLPSTPPHFY